MIFSSITALIIYLPLVSLIIFTVIEFLSLKLINVNLSQLWPVLVSSGLQSLLSAAFAVGFGFLGALGLSAFRGKREFIKLILLTPNFLPPMIVILSVLDITESSFWVFGGLGDVVFAHSVINIGLCTVLIENLISSKNLNFFKLAFVEGAANLIIFKEYIKYLFFDISYIFILIFFLCFSSFSIPLLLGGVEGKTIEVLIFESIKIDGNFAQGVIISSIEILIFSSLFIFYRKQKNKLQYNNLMFPFYKKKFLVFPILTVAIALWSLLVSLDDLFTISYPKELTQLLPSAVINSLAVGVGVGLTLYFVLNLITYNFSKLNFNKFLYNFNISSSVMLALGAYFIKINFNLNQYVALCLALVAILFPTLYRARGFAALEQLRDYHKVSKVLGANKFLNFKLLYKVNHRVYALLAAIGGFWAFGDFAVSKLLLDHSSTLPLIISDLVKSYRLDLALALNWLMLFFGGVTFLIILGIDYVISKTNKI